jgi:hypothetical protein
MGDQIPEIVENPLWVVVEGSSRKFHSGVKKAQDWVVDQLVDIFHTTHKTKTQQMTRNWGQ